MRDRGECGGSLEGELTEKPPIIRPAPWSEHAIKEGKILRACEREHIVARSERRGRRSAASDPILNYHQYACCGRERQCLHRFRNSQRARFHSIACHHVLVAESAREIDVQTGSLLKRGHIEIKHPRDGSDRPTLKDQRYQHDSECYTEEGRGVRQSGEDRDDRKEDRDGASQPDP